MGHDIACGGKNSRNNDYDCLKDFAYVPKSFKLHCDKDASSHTFIQFITAS